MVLLTLTCLASLPLTASAQDPHARRGRVMYVMGDEAAVVVRPDAVWAPANTIAADPVSVCGSSGCSRVASIEDCETPACPGGGRVLVSERSIADVDDFPEGLEEWNEEVDAMASDTVIGQLVGSYRGTHPDEGREPDGWRNADHEGWEWELSYGPAIATPSDTWHTAMGATISIGFRGILEAGAIDDDIDGFWETVFGDTYGADLRLRVLRGIDDQSSDWMVSVGIAPVIYNAVGEGRLRLPALPYGLAVPELGVVTRSGRPAAFYVGWSAPLAVLVTDDLGISLNANAMLVDGWAPGEEAEWLLGAQLSAIMR